METKKRKAELDIATSNVQAFEASQVDMENKRHCGVNDNIINECLNDYTITDGATDDAINNVMYGRLETNDDVSENDMISEDTTNG